MLQTQRGTDREKRLANCQKAIDALNKRLGAGDPKEADINRLLLAGIYEQMALLSDDPRQLRTALQESRKLMSQVVDRANTPVGYIAQYSEFLLRQAKRLAGRNDSRELVELSASLLSEADQRIAKLQVALRESPDRDQKILPAQMRARWLTLQGKDTEAKQLLDEFGDQQLAALGDDEKKDNRLLAKLYAQVGNAHFAAGQVADGPRANGHYADAERWYRKLAAAVPDSDSYALLVNDLHQQGRTDEALNLALQAYDRAKSASRATVLSQLLSSGKVTNADLRQRAMNAVADAYQNHADNRALLMAVAVQAVTLGNNAEAVRLFKQVLDVDAKNLIRAEQPGDAACGKLRPQTVGGSAKLYRPGNCRRRSHAGAVGHTGHDPHL